MNQPKIELKPLYKIYQSEVDAELAGKRLDQVLAQLYTDYSRAKLQSWIKQGLVKVNGQCKRPKDKVQAGDQIQLKALLEDQVALRPQKLPLNILYEDEAMIIINKPAGLVVHPGAGQPDQTLLNALLHHEPKLAQLPRAGIVHRLDKDTTGLMVIARSQAAYTHLVAELQARRIERHYLALVQGQPIAGGTIDAPIGRHPKQRTRMSIQPQGKPARTHYRIQKKWARHALLHCRLETGRTHQIRVHLASIQLPLLGDPVYGRHLILPPQPTEALRRALQSFKRQALHAFYLKLKHPQQQKELQWQIELPEDMQTLVHLLDEQPIAD